MYGPSFKTLNLLLLLSRIIPTFSVSLSLSLSRYPPLSVSLSLSLSLSLSFSLSISPFPYISTTHQEQIAVLDANITRLNQNTKSNSYTIRQNILRLNIYLEVRKEE